MLIAKLLPSQSIFIHLENKKVHTYFLAFTAISFHLATYLLAFTTFLNKHDPNKFTARKQGAVSDQ